MSWWWKAAIGTVLGGGLVYELVRRYRTPARQLKAACEGARDTCPTNIGTPSPTNTKPIEGQASALDYRWCVIVKEGDTAGQIATRITGDARRYLELLAANPKKPLKRDPVTGEVNFESLCEGERLVLPRSWAPWMDQLGNPRGQKIAFPPFDRLPPYPVATEISEGKVPADGRWV